MIWTAWKNGKHNQMSTSYGFKVRFEDRARYFDRAWQVVSVELPRDHEFHAFETNVAKASFWDPGCGELIDVAIREWLYFHGFAPWPYGSPPKFEAEAIGPRHLRVVKRVAG